MASCYIIYSQKLNRFYVGATRKLVQKRVDEHNTNFYGNFKYTSKAEDWELYIEIQASNYKHALEIEKKIKSQKSSVYIQNLKKYPEIIDKILEETRG